MVKAQPHSEAGTGPTISHEAFCAVSTREALDFVDVTDDVQGAIASSGVRAGRITIFAPTDRCTLVANERESGLLKDIRAAVDRVRAAEPVGISGSIGARSVVVPIVDGRLRLGTWQRILLFELEGPHDRSLFIQIVGER